MATSRRKKLFNESDADFLEESPEPSGGNRPCPTPSFKDVYRASLLDSGSLRRHRNGAKRSAVINQVNEDEENQKIPTKKTKRPNSVKTAMTNESPKWSELFINGPSRPKTYQRLKNLSFEKGATKCNKLSAKVSSDSQSLFEDDFDEDLLPLSHLLKKKVSPFRSKVDRKGMAENEKSNRKQKQEEKRRQTALRRKQELDEKRRLGEQKKKQMKKKQPCLKQDKPGPAAKRQLNLAKKKAESSMMAATKSNLKVVSSGNCTKKKSIISHDDDMTMEASGSSQSSFAFVEQTSTTKFLPSINDSTSSVACADEGTSMPEDGGDAQVRPDGQSENVSDTTQTQNHAKPMTKEMTQALDEVDKEVQSQLMKLRQDISGHFDLLSSTNRAVVDLSTSGGLLPMATRLAQVENQLLETAKKQAFVCIDLVRQTLTAKSTAFHQIIIKPS